MPVIRTLTDRIAANLGDNVIRFRWLVILATLVVVAALCRIGEQELISGFDYFNIIVQGITHGYSYV